MTEQLPEECFVLKLSFERNKGDYEIRRVRLPRTEANGNNIEITYEELVKMVIQLACPEDNDPNPNEYCVRLTYHDVNSDLVLVGSTEELVDALEQYSEKGVLQMFAKVDRKVVASESQSVRGQEEAVYEQKPPPFIHGRHECDSCSIFPIVGKRYHAINLPNYDICENCKKSIKAEEIAFEDVEDDCDRRFQQLWQSAHPFFEMFAPFVGLFGPPLGNVGQGTHGSGPTPVGHHHHGPHPPPPPSPSPPFGPWSHPSFVATNPTGPHHPHYPHHGPHPPPPHHAHNFHGCPFGTNWVDHQCWPHPPFRPTCRRRGYPPSFSPEAENPKGCNASWQENKRTDTTPEGGQEKK